MINRCITNSFENSISFNPINDDLTMKNYIALAKCIVGIKTDEGVKYPDISKTCRAYGLYQLNNDKKYGRKIIATNIEDGQTIEFENIKQAAEFFNYKEATLRTYVDAPKKANKVWKLIALDLA